MQAVPEILIIARITGTPAPELSETAEAQAPEVQGVHPQGQVQGGQSDHQSQPDRRDQSPLHQEQGHLHRKDPHQQAKIREDADRKSKKKRLSLLLRHEISRP